MLKAIIISAAALAVSVPAAAQEQAAKDRKSDVERIVCKKEETIGSRLAAKKVCMTVSEWRRHADLNREETERAQLNARAPESN